MATTDPVVDADYAEHVASYHSFLRGARYAVIGIAAILILMAYFLT